MTTVRIGEKDYPWPENCPHCRVANGIAEFRCGPGHNQASWVDVTILTDDGDAICAEYWTRTIASVAARHFRNKILPTKFNNVLGVMVIDAERELERRAMFDAAKAWETLCNDL